MTDRTWPPLSPSDPRWRRTAQWRRLVLRGRYRTLARMQGMIAALTLLAARELTSLEEDADQLWRDIDRCVEAELERERRSA